MEGIIIGNISNTYKIETIETTYIAHARGKFKNQDIKPLVGDRVEIEVIDEEKNEAIIEEIKTRKNEIKRPKIANIDQIVFIISTKNFPLTFCQTSNTPSCQTIDVCALCRYFLRSNLTSNRAVLMVNPYFRQIHESI